MKNRLKRAPITPSYDKYSSWHTQQSTQQLFFLESQWLSSLLAQHAFGNLLYLGCDQNIKKHLQYPQHKIVQGLLDWQGTERQADLVMELEHWPLADESVDFLIMQHLLEFSQSPHQLVREASRVISANGCALIVAHNPFSSWGLQQKLRWGSVNMPWIANAISASRLIDWFHLLGFSVEQRFSMAHLWPSQMLSPEKLTLCDQALAQQQIWPGNVFMLLVRKRVMATTKVKTRRQQILHPNYGWAIGRAGLEQSSAFEKTNNLKQ